MSTTCCGVPRSGCRTVSGEHARVEQVLDEAERWLWGRPELEVVSVRRWVRSVDDD